MSYNEQSIGYALNYLKNQISGIYPEEETTAISRSLVGSVTGLRTPSLLSAANTLLSNTQWDKINKICNQLKKSIPLQYALGYADFYDIRLSVNSNVLIPRPETEELVDLIIKENQQENLRIIDIGTGSGCIAIALAMNMKAPVVTGTDISDKALQLASENARMLDCDINFILDDISETSLKPSMQFDIVVSNPPYVRDSEKAFMHLNVTDYEPSIALFVTDDDPLRFYRHIITFCKLNLVQGGKLYLEINEAFGVEIMNLLEESGLNNVIIIKDLNDKDRIVKSSWI